jgi:hypothetical protein
MKTINEKFTDEEHKILTKSKGKKNWHDFIMELAKETAKELNQHD